jgi:cytochrome c peroxidase
MVISDSLPFYSFYMIRFRPKLRTLYLQGLMALVTGASWAGTTVPKMRLEIQPVWGDQPISAAVSGQSSVEIRLSRLDYLLSKLALKKADGTWLESSDWFAFFSLEKGRLRAEADGLPAEAFSAIRFQVGVPPEANAADPAQWSVDHALNPQICGLHWGWQGGYVFMALEGYAPGQRAFSYHLANDPNVAMIELPVEFRGGGPLTLHLTLNAARLLQGIDLEKDGTSTHSRAGDLLAGKLRANVKSAFQLVKVSHDLYQPTEPALKNAARPEGAHDFPIAITERFPQVSLPPDNPLTREGVALGKKLFHDTRLSINSTQSCASCHQQEQALSDARRYSLGAEGQIGTRQAMPLFNLAWAQGFFWDGRAKTLREQVLMPIQDKHEMHESLERVVEKLEQDAEMKTKFDQAFGSAGISADRIAKALEQYLLTLISQDSRFDQAVRKVTELSEQEKRGLQLFVTEHDPKRGLMGADCFHCHGGTLFTDHQYRDNGLTLAAEDLGRMMVTGEAKDREKFKTPSLRNIAVTAPYMHDGRFATLEEVVAHYSGPMIRRDTLDPNLAKHPETGIQLSVEAQRDLVAFLKTLTDEDFVHPAKAPQVVKQP